MTSAPPPPPGADVEPQPLRVHGGTPATLAARVRLGASTDAAPDVLAALAADPAVTVRAAVALNAAAPADADRILARDSDARVRTLLARKLAALLPSLQNTERERLRRHVMEMLAELVEDEAVRVRAAISDVVKEMPQAPHELILRLANDSAVPVSEPVTRLSPLLTTEDLLALLAANPNRATAAAVAAREGLNETLADAVVATFDPAAIRALLANDSAAIREATLDALIVRAADHADWQAALVRRSRLSPKAACALSKFVATHLLHELASRADLSAECAAELERRLAQRLERDHPPCGATVPNMAEAMGAAWALAHDGRLDEAALLGAVQRGETRMATAMLAVAAGVPVMVVERAVALRSTKAMVSLVWRAGFSVHVAGPLQSLLARIPPAGVLRSGPGGSWPLVHEEMRWQIDFLTRMER
jgi:uncharacterized protein (DUF2336 family)